MKKNNAGSKNLLDEIANRNIQLQQTMGNESVLETVTENQNDERIKRGYTLKVTSLNKLQELKVFVYGAKSNYNEIIEEAIDLLYQEKREQKK